MKTKHKTHTRRHPHSVSSKLAKGVDFESLASDLDQLAKGKLPDGCLDGVLKGQEPEIRQDAVLLALRWFGKCTNKEEWIPAASIAHALRFQRGSISTSNAAIVLMVLEEGQPVSTMAKKLKLTPGAIYYHINQVRAVLPSIVANIEEPGFCSKFSDLEEAIRPF